MQLDIGNIVSVIIGGLLVVFGQWILSRQNAKRERGEATRRFREERARPIIEALDRAAHRWDYETHMELADTVGYEGESVDIQSEEYKQQLSERRKKYFEQLKDDISAASTVHDDAVRRLVTNVLWRSVDTDFRGKDFSEKLQEAYLKLEKWILEP